VSDLKPGDIVVEAAGSALVVYARGNELLLAAMTDDPDRSREDLLTESITGEDTVSGSLEGSYLLELDRLSSASAGTCEKVAELDRDRLEAVIRKLSKLFPVVYHDLFHKAGPFVPGESRVNYAGRVWDESEIRNLIDASLDFWLTAGRFEKNFCRKLSEYLGIRHVITANSGSSANLLAISALTSQKLGERSLVPGDEVITVAAGFPTTIVPLVQNGLVPVFVDIELGTLNIDTAGLEDAVSGRTKAIFLAHTLGVPFEADRVMEVARKHCLWVVEDSCDALGASWDGRHTGTIGDLGTFSFYPAHHITMGEGGAVVTGDARLERLVRSFRDWGRDCWCDTGSDNTCGKRFSQQWGTLPLGYDHKYVYSHFGYNMKITDMQAAVGLAQLGKLDAFVKRRRDNWNRLHAALSEFDEFFILPEPPKRAEISPFGFALTIRDRSPFTRGELTGYLEEKMIQTRTVFAGNIIRQPVFHERDVTYRVAGGLVNTDKVMNDTFWVGVYPGMNDEAIEYMIDAVKGFLGIKGFPGGKRS